MSTEKMIIDFVSNINERNPSEITAFFNEYRRTVMPPWKRSDLCSIGNERVLKSKNTLVDVSGDKDSNRTTNIQRLNKRKRTRIAIISEPLNYDKNASYSEFKQEKNSSFNCDDSEVSSQTLLVQAVLSKDTDEVIRLLKIQNIDVNQTDNQFRSLLFIAIEQGHTKIASLLLGRAEIKVLFDSSTALHLAVSCSNVEIVEQLVTRKDIRKLLSAKDDMGMGKTPFEIAQIKLMNENMTGHKAIRMTKIATILGQAGKKLRRSNLILPSTSQSSATNNSPKHRIARSNSLTNNIGAFRSYLMSEETFSVDCDRPNNLDVTFDTVSAPSLPPLERMTIANFFGKVGCGTPEAKLECMDKVLDATGNNTEQVFPIDIPLIETCVHIKGCVDLGKWRVHLLEKSLEDDYINDILNLEIDCRFTRRALIKSGTNSPLPFAARKIVEREDAFDSNNSSYGCPKVNEKQAGGLSITANSNTTDINESSPNGSLSLSDENTQKNSELTWLSRFINSPEFRWDENKYGERTFITLDGLLSTGLGIAVGMLVMGCLGIASFGIAPAVVAAALFVLLVIRIAARNWSKNGADFCKAFFYELGSSLCKALVVAAGTLGLGAMWFPTLTNLPFFASLGFDYSLVCTLVAGCISSLIVDFSRVVKNLDNGNAPNVVSNSSEKKPRDRINTSMLRVVDCLSNKEARMIRMQRGEETGQPHVCFKKH